jgi:hypothetical protein
VRKLSDEIDIRSQSRQKQDRAVGPIAHHAITDPFVPHTCKADRPERHNGIVPDTRSLRIAARPPQISRTEVPRTPSRPAGIDGSARPSPPPSSAPASDPIDGSGSIRRRHIERLGEARSQPVRRGRSADLAPWRSVPRIGQASGARFGRSSAPAESAGVRSVTRDEERRGPQYTRFWGAQIDARATPDRRFRVGHLPARRVFCATADERSGRRGQVVAASCTS